MLGDTLKTGEDAGRVDCTVSDKTQVIKTSLLCLSSLDCRIISRFTYKKIQVQYGMCSTFTRPSNGHGRIAAAHVPLVRSPLT